MIIRGGRNLGSTCYLPEGRRWREPNEALASFLMQYYAETAAATRKFWSNLELDGSGCIDRRPR